MSAESPNVPTLRTDQIQKKLARRRAIKESWPLLVWLGFIALSYWIWTLGTTFKHMNGAVSGVQPSSISAIESGTLQDLRVQVGDRVEINDEVATMDSSELEQKSLVLNHDLVAEMGVAEGGGNAGVYRLISQRIGLQGDLGDAEADQNRDSSTVALKEERLARAKKVLAQRIPNSGFNQNDIDKLEEDIERLRGKLAGYVSLIPQLQKQISDVIALIKDAETGAIQPQVTRVDIDQHPRMIELQARIAGMTLKSSKAGTVDRVLRQEGEYVKVGDPIVDIVVDGVKSITGFVPEDAAFEMKVGDKVFVSPANDVDLVMEGSISHLGPRIVSVRDQGSPLPNRRLRGREMIIDLKPEEAAVLLPGQRVRIYRDEPGAAFWKRWFNM